MLRNNSKEIYFFRKKIIEIIKKYKNKELMDKLRESFSDTILFENFGTDSKMSDESLLGFLKTEILYPESLKVTIRIWHRSGLRSPLSTHTSLETKNIYASLWPGESEGSPGVLETLARDLGDRLYHPAIGEFGDTIELYGLNPSSIDNAFNKFKVLSIPWNAYGSCNCTYIAYLCKATLSLCSFNHSGKLLLHDIYQGDSEQDVDKFYKKEHNILNCSGLVLCLIEHGGIYQLTQLPLMSAKGNKILLSLMILNYLCMVGYVILLAAVAIKSIIEGKVGVPNVNAEYPDGKYMVYILGGSIGASLIAYAPYWFANLIYECRGIGFLVTPNGIKWLSQKVEVFEKNQQEELYSRLDALTEEVNLNYQASKVSRHELEISEQLISNNDNYTSSIEENNDKKSINWMQKKHGSRSERKSSHSYSSVSRANSEHDEYRAMSNLDEPKLSKRKCCAIL